MTDPYVRTFPAQHQGWMRAEIDRLIQSMPDQPAWATDPLRTGECMVIIKLVSPPTTPSPSSSNDLP